MRKNLEPNNPAVLSPKQLEVEFGISLNKQDKLRTRKSQENDGVYALPFFKVGKEVRYQREAIMRWFSKLEEKEQSKRELK